MRHTGPFIIRVSCRPCSASALAGWSSEGYRRLVSLGCNSDLNKAAEMLEYIRASFKVLCHVRPKLSCDACERNVQALAPSRPISPELAGPGLLTHVMVSKHADHQPLCRQSEIYAREGVDLDRSTLAGWSVT